MTPAALKALEEGNVANFIAASTPGGIEAQEATGQKQLVSDASYLPKEMLHGCTRAHLEAMGIVFGFDRDDIFVSVTLLNGWSIKPTEHSMWSCLLDDKGRERAQIFYKAAFYDRKAHISLVNRYDVTRYVEVAKDTYATAVTDCGKPIHQVGVRGRHEHSLGDKQAKLATKWLDERFPEWRNPLAYWD